MKLFERVETIAIHFEGSRAGLAKLLAPILEKTPRAIEGYFNDERENNLWPLLPKILEIYPTINDSWLFLGRGPMLKADTFPPPRSAKNQAGKYTGDLLGVALGFLHLTPEDAAKKLGRDVSELQLLLESRVAPDFDQLEALYRKLNINPAYFFNGNERQMHRPDNLLLQVFHVLGKSYIEPDVLSIAEIFHVSDEEAEAFLTDWREDRRHGRNRVLPETWLHALQSYYSFNPGWLAEGTPPVLLPMQDHARASPAPDLAVQVQTLQAEVAYMKEIADLQRKLLNQYEQRQDSAEFGGFPGQTGKRNPPTGENAAPTAPTSISAELHVTGRDSKE